MYYSAIGTLALLILLIENQDVLLNRRGDFSRPAWKVYRGFLAAVLVYYITDIIWGLLEAEKLAVALFADTSVYFFAMAAGVLFWTWYTVVYLDDRSARFGRLPGQILLWFGRGFAVVAVLMVIINLFTPVLFTVDEACVYTALDARYVLLIGQIVMLVALSVYSFTYMARRRGSGKRNRCLTLGLFGLIKAIFLTAQLWFPYLPLYACGYMLGTCLLRAFVIGEEKEEYRLRAEEGERVVELKQSISALLDNMPALSFYKDAETGVYLACNQAFAEYAHKADPDGVIGRTDAELFDAETAKHFAEDDRIALSMDRPYIFFEDVPDAAGNQRQFQTTKLQFTDASGRRCLLGMGQDVTSQEKIRHAEERMREQRDAISRLNALTGDFLCIYVVDPDTEQYREFTATEGFNTYALPKEGMEFFNATRAMSRGTVYPEDLDRFLALFTKQAVMSEVEQNGIFSITYRLVVEGNPTYVRLKAAMVEEMEGKRLIVGINDIDSHVRQEAEYEQRLAQAQTQASVDALTGVKNRHAFLDAEEKLDHRILEGEKPEFAVTILDVNDLKKVNDTSGHQAGDQYLRDACRLICHTFKHSPVYRIGGDEFAVISQGHDYEHIEELTGQIAAHNEDALREGGIVIACGTAKCEGDSCVTPVFDRADTRMYENKNFLKQKEKSAGTKAAED